MKHLRPSLPILLLVALLTGSALLKADQPVFVDGALVVPLDKDKNESTSTTRLEDLATVRTLPVEIGYPVIPEDEARAFARYLEDLARELALPGFALAIIQGDRIATQTTYGLRKATDPAPVDPATLFNIGPATQAFSSLLAATLDDSAAFSYDKTCRRIWSRFRMSDSRSATQVTLYDLFTMTAGIPTYTDNILDPTWARPEDVFEAIAQAPVIAPPGRIYERSMLSAAAAGYLTGLSAERGAELYTAYTTTARKRLFEPLDMSTATFSREAAERSANYASPHQRKGQGYDPSPRWEPAVNALAPALGLKASLQDMSRWLITELQGGITPDGQRVALTPSVRQRWQPARVSSGDSFGMGWTRQYYQSVEIIATMGSYDRHSAGIGILPRYRTGFIIMINADGEHADRLMQETALGLAELMLVAATTSQDNSTD